MLFQNYQQVKYYTLCDCLYKYENKTRFTFPRCVKAIISSAISAKTRTLFLLLFFYLCFYVIFFQQPKLHAILKRKKRRLKKVKRKHRKKARRVRILLYCSCALYKKNLFAFLHYLALFELNNKFFFQFENIDNSSMSFLSGCFLIPIYSLLLGEKLKGLLFTRFNYHFYIKFLFKLNFFNKIKFSKINKYFLIQNSLCFNQIPIK